MNCLETLNLKANYWINIPESMEKLKEFIGKRDDISLLPHAMFLPLLFWLIGNSLWIIAYICYPNEFKECRELMTKRRRELEQNMNKK